MTNTPDLLLVVDTAGVVRCVYGETIDLRLLGTPAITRASHVEPDELGRWWADLRPVKGPSLGPFDLRGDALAAEVRWLETYWLGTSARSSIPPSPASDL